MAEVASSLGVSSQSTTETVPDMPELDLCPSVKEAMDRILPHSASQLLQTRLSFEDTSPQNGSLSCEIRENGDGRVTSSRKPYSRLPLDKEDQKKSGLQKRVPKADLEIITAVDAAGTDFNEKVSRKSSLDKPLDLSSKAHSDSDDVSRPFAVVREKKKEKRKRRKKQSKSASQETSDGDSEEEFVCHRDKMKQKVLQSENSNTNSDFPLADVEIIPKTSNTVLTNGTDRLDLNENGLPPTSGDTDKYKQCESQLNYPVSDDMSNNSFSSTKENVESRKRLERQKLPKAKLPFYNTVKHKNKIKKTFPPCYVVIEQISALLSNADTRSLNLALTGKESGETPGKVLPLSVRLKNLSTSCAKGLISCRKNKKDTNSHLKHRNIFEDYHTLDSEEDFEVVRGGRSLRKRDKTINYVEPTEADIFVEFSRKRRSKGKDCAIESQEEIKKRKVNLETEDSVSNKDNSSSPKGDKRLPQDCAKAKLCDSKNDKSHSYAKAKPTSSNGPQEVVVYPKSSSNKDSASNGNKSKPVAIRAAPISLSPSPTMRSLLTTQPPPGLISTFSPYLTSIAATPGVHPLNASRSPIIPAVPNSSMVRPQFCMVRMDGKDVLLQVLPPSSPGAASQGTTLLLPGGKRLVIPPNHHMSRQIGQAPRVINSLSMSAMPMPLISQVPPGFTTTAPAISSAASHCVPLSIPSLSTSQSFDARSIPSTSLLQGTRTITTVYPPLSTVSTAAASLTSSPQPIQAPVAMAAPNSTTVVRNIRVPTSNLRATVPNQPGGVRAVRIFVPGCQATGVPGRFATLGSVTSSSSALTRLSASSDLLPQKKQAKDMLTPEQRAEKRRKLEKKYPLPPGVIIKTEPLDSPSSSQSASTYSRSLLPGSIQVVSAARRPGASGVQSIRFLNPASAAAALGSSGTMPLTNIFVRASSGDGRQTFLIPSSLGMLASRTPLRASIATSASSSGSVESSSVIVSSASCVSGGGNISILPTFTSTMSFNTTNYSSSNGQLPLETAVSPSPSPSVPRSADTAQGATAVIVKLKAEIEAMNKLVTAQEGMGLRGDRIEKLKELLKKKQNSLRDLLDQAEKQVAESRVDDSESGDMQPALGQSETEPIEID